MENHKAFIDVSCEDGLSSNSDSFESFSTKLLKGFIEPQILEILKNYCLLSAMTSYKPEVSDGLVPGAHSGYSDTLFESLLEKYWPEIERVLNLGPLWPTFSYYRVYRPGEILKPHRDRSSCELTCTFCIGFDYQSSDFDWPIYTESLDGPVLLSPGDMLIFKGVEAKHWREEFRAPLGSWHAQASFHFVRREGPYSEFKFDKRAMLGLPKFGTD